MPESSNQINQFDDTYDMKHPNQPNRSPSTLLESFYFLDIEMSIVGPPTSRYGARFKIGLNTGRSVSTVGFV